MTKIDFNQLTLDNGAVQSLGEVLFTTAFKLNPLFETCTQRPGVTNGKKLDFIDSMGDLGVTGRKCDPEYTGVEIKGAEKEWSLGPWNIAKKLCYEDLEETIAEYTLRTGTPREDIIGTDFWDKIFLPLFNRAVQEMYWRMAWFMDKNADNVSAGGVLTNGIDKTLFTMEDGLWKRIFALGTANADQRTTIAANAATSYADQKSGIRAAGVALGILDAMLTDADSRIMYASDARIMMTNSLYQAYRKDYQAKYSQTIPFREVAEGKQLPTFEGVAIKVIPEWDNMIKKYEDTGAKLNAPHRAVFCSPSNLFVGTEDTSIFATFDVTFDRIKRFNHTYAASNIGTLLGEDNLIQAAY